MLLQYRSRTIHWKSIELFKSELGILGFISNDTLSQNKLPQKRQKEGSYKIAKILKLQIRFEILESWS